MSKLNPQKASAYVGPGVLKQGGKITPVPNGPLIKKNGKFKGSTLKSGGKIKKAQGGMGSIMGMMGGGGGSGDDDKKKAEAQAKANANMIKGVIGNARSLYQNQQKLNAKSGGMLKRKDGSTSKRGLWDNIRANKGSGKKPTAEMLKQERKIKAKK